MKFGVVIFPGSNCDQDLIQVLSDVTKSEVVELWHKDHDLKNCDFIFLPGGFSYGDYLRSGAIAKLSPIMDEVIAFANNGGYVMGICNGFQILCESGLLPGALLRNNNQKFVCKNVFLKTMNNDTILTKTVDSTNALEIPIAHAEGRFYADDATIQSMENNGQILFKYATQDGEITEEVNPNGSIKNIAGICNANKNVFGMMPHPERCANSDLFNEDGKALFESLMSEMVSA